MSCKAHWEKIYKEKSSQEVSWTQETPTTSIDFFSDFKIQKDDPIIDVGCGESKFVDYLIDNMVFWHLTYLWDALFTIS